MANQFLSLSLFLMLLSFFIIMNTVSERDYDQERAKSVMNSLSLAFTAKETAPKDAPGVEPTPYKALREGDTLEVVEGLFNGHISNVQIRKNRFGTQMHVRLPVSSFENAISFPMLSGGGSNSISGNFLDMLVTVLRSEEGGRPYRLDMALNIPSDPATYRVERAEDFQRSLRIVARFAETIEATGMPKKMISAGLEEGRMGYIDLYFNKYVPFSSAPFLAQIEKK